MYAYDSSHSANWRCIIRIDLSAANNDDNNNNNAATSIASAIRERWVHFGHFNGRWWHYDTFWHVAMPARIHILRASIRCQIIFDQRQLKTLEYMHRVNKHVQQIIIIIWIVINIFISSSVSSGPGCRLVFAAMRNTSIQFNYYNLQWITTPECKSAFLNGQLKCRCNSFRSPPLNGPVCVRAPQ